MQYKYVDVLWMHSFFNLNPMCDVEENPLIMLMLYNFCHIRDPGYYQRSDEDCYLDDVPRSVLYRERSSSQYLINVVSSEAEEGQSHGIHQMSTKTKDIYDCSCAPAVCYGETVVHNLNNALGPRFPDT
jgi:hypothetical protein